MYFVTFNYDSLIEEALADRFGIAMTQMGIYIQHDHYKVFKLHGSLMWFHQVDSPTGLAQEVTPELFTRAAELKLGPGFALLPWDTPAAPTQGAPPVVPAIALPLAQKTEFECPADHLDALRSAIPHVTKLLIVGWRAREQHFLALLRAFLPPTADAIVIGRDAGDVRLVSRNGPDHTKRFRQIVDALAGLKPATFTLDGEVAVFDEELVSHFEAPTPQPRRPCAPPLCMASDLLRLMSKDYRPEPLRVRRRALEKLVKGQTLILPARRLSPNGFAAWTEVVHWGWEGMVAKDPESPYVAGRSLRWLKVKQPDYRVEERGWDRKNS